MNERQLFALADIVSKTAILNITIRDLFAAFALAGIAAANMDHDYPVDAAMAYSYADAMLAQRQRKESQQK